MATTNGGWVSVRSIRGRFEDAVPVDSLSTTESASERLLHDSLDDFEERLSSCRRNSPMNEVEAGVKERHYFRQHSDDRLARRRDSYELQLKGNGRKITPRRLQSDEGPCLNGERAVQSQSHRLPARKGGYQRRDKDPELLAWKSLQNVNGRAVKNFDSSHNRDQVSSISSDGSEEIDYLGKKHGRDIYVKVKGIRESISPVVLRRKSNYDVTPEDVSLRMRHERKFLDQNSSPVLDFRERKLAFEKAVGALDERFKSLTKSTLKTRSVARKAHSNESANNFPVEAPKHFSSKNSSESTSANSSFEAEESLRNGSSSYHRHSRANRFARLRPTSSSTGSSKSSKNSSPRISKGKRSDVFDFDSEKEIDSTESQESRVESPIERSDETELNLHHAKHAKERAESGTEDEEIPVFCVQDFVRGRERTRKESPARSRSEGDELKARNLHAPYIKVHEHKNESYRKVAKSSNDINVDDNDHCLQLAFRDKQRMLEDIMNAENAFNGVKHPRARSSSPRKGARVFRKMSFTSKSDKDRRNKIARGRLPMNHPMSKKQHDPVDNLNDISSKKSFSKLIPKIPPFAPALRFPLVSNEKAKLDVRESCSSNPENIQKKTSSVVLGRNFLGRNETNFSSKLSEMKKEIKEMKEFSYFDKNKSNEADNRKSLPEVDLMQLKPTLNGSHRRNKSIPNDIAVASVLSSSSVMENVDLSMNKPIKPSELYDSKRSRKYSDFTNDLSGDTLNYSSLPISTRVPVRPPRRRNSEFPRKKSKAPQPPSQVQPNGKFDEESVIREQILEYSSKSESSPASVASCSPLSEAATHVSTTEAHLLTAGSNLRSIISSSSGSDKNCSDDTNTHIPLPMVLPELVNENDKCDHLSSVSKLSDPVPSPVPDISFVDARKPSPDLSIFQSISLGPRPYQVASLPVSNNEQNLDSTTASGSPVEQTAFSSMGQSCLAPAGREDDSGPSLLFDSSNVNTTSRAESGIPSTVMKATVNLPPGPPPQKPPRTFAHDIYSTQGCAHGSVNSKTNASPSSPDHPKPKIIEPLISPSPLYSVVNKKSATPKHSTSNSCSKPTIAPKPSHIKTLFKNKRLSLAEPTLNNSLCDDDVQNRNLTTFSHLRYSFRKNPPDVPPPEPPNNPKPSKTKAGLTDATEPEAASLCNHYSEAFVGVNEGKLNRQRSISDETLCSSSGYHRVAGDPPREHIYATPDLQGAGRKAGSGGELHYLCSDLMRGARGSHFGAELTDRRANASPSNLISAWKHEFRQSCRLMQSKIKKSVNR